MVTVEHFDLLVFGGGKAGKTLAMDQAKTGRRVAMIEVGMIGGSCINIACIPSKALIRSAEITNFVAHADDFGTTVEGARLNMERVAARTAEVVSEMVHFNQMAFDASGLDLALGWGRFVEPRVIEVTSKAGGRRRLTGDRIYINLGTVAAIPEIPGLRAAKPMTHVEALTLTELPARLLVIGGGYVGLEMAQAFRGLGSDVVVIEAGSRLAAREDDDVVAEIATLFEEQGIQVVTAAKDLHVRGESGKRVDVTVGNGQTIWGTHLLVATGRIPMTADIGMDIAGVELDDRGFIKVNEHLQTSARGIWALGEVAGSPMFTHASLDDFRVAKSHLDGGARTTKNRLVPSCMFIEPEFARVGLSEKEANRLGVGYRLAKLPMDVVPRARTMSSRKGFMKCLISKETDDILGFSMLGERAGEVMTVLQTAILGRVPFTILRDAILAHPTIAEGLNMLLSAVRPLESS
jgi:pyruvate/2-oxoglutarate dehydrogenase complex dihydrolipoamide dehydrogenase (E3) component